MALSADYEKKLRYLRDKSNKGTLNNNDRIYKELIDKARNLPELQRAMNSLKVNYV
jgi:hypothetical protein